MSARQAVAGLNGRVPLHLDKSAKLMGSDLGGSSSGGFLGVKALGSRDWVEVLIGSDYWRGGAI